MSRTKSLASRPKFTLRHRNRRKSLKAHCHASQALEQRTLMSAVNGTYEGQGELEEAITDELEVRTDALAHVIAEATSAFEQLPLPVSELEATVQQFVDETFAWESFEGLLAEEGVEIESIASWEEWNNGTADDLIVLNFDRTFGFEPVEVSASGSLGADGPVKLSAEGYLSFDGALQINATFGLDQDGRFFMVEGAEFQIEYSTGDDDHMTGTLDIENLGAVQAQISGASEQPLLSVDAGLILDDGDATSQERLYFEQIVDTVSDASAVDLDGEFAAEATLSVDSPVSMLPEFLRSAANAAGFADTLDWNASVAADLTTGDMTYEVEELSIPAVDQLFSSSGTFEDRLFATVLDNLKEHNPIPESVQSFLTTKIPLIDSSVLDLLEVPTTAQYIIAPSALGTNSPSGSDDGVSLDLTFFEPDNLTRFLSGQDYDIISLGAEGTFKRDLGTIPVIPETVVFSYLGIANATAEVQLTPGFEIGIDVEMGFDSNGFYVVGETESVAIDPHLRFGGGLKVSVIAEGDVLFLLDLARATIDVGLTGFGDLTFQSPHDSTRMRARDLAAGEVAVGLGVDLNLGLKGEVGLVDFDQFDKDWETSRDIELYRHESGTSIEEIKQQLKAFGDKFKSKGRDTLFAAAAATGQPELVAGAAVILYQEHGEDIASTARAMVQDFGFGLGTTFRAMHQEFGASLIESARIMRSELNSGITEIADVVRNELGGSLYQTAESLVKGADASLDSMVRTLKSELRATNTEIAEILARLGVDLREQLLDFLNSNLSLGQSLDYLGDVVNKTLPRLDPNALSDFAGGFSTNLTRRLPSLIGDKAVAYMMTRLDVTSLSSVAGRLTYKKTAALIHRYVSANAVGQLGARFSSHAAERVLNYTSSSRHVANMVRSIHASKMLSIARRMSTSNLTKVAGKLHYATRSFVINRLPTHTHVRAFLNGMDPAQVANTIGRMKDFSAKLNAVRNWIPYSTANEVLRLLPSETLRPLLRRFAASDVERFARSGQLGVTSLRQVFSLAYRSTSANALGRLLNHDSRFRSVIESLPTSRIRSILPKAAGSVRDRIFRHVSPHEAADIINHVSDSLKSAIFQQVRANNLRDSRRFWNSATKSVQSNLQRAGRSLIRFSSGSSWWRW